MNVVEALSKVSGQSEKSVKEIFEEVKENHRKLRSCPGPHEFILPKRKVGDLVTDWTCRVCNGHVPNIQKHWYEQGLIHGMTKEEK